MDALERLQSDIDKLNTKISTESDAIKTLVTELRSSNSDGDEDEINAIADKLEAATARIDSMLPADPASTTPPPADVPPADSTPSTT